MEREMFQDKVTRENSSKKEISYCLQPWLVDLTNLLACKETVLQHHASQTLLLELSISEAMTSDYWNFREFEVVLHSPFICDTFHYNYIYLFALIRV